MLGVVGLVLGAACCGTIEFVFGVAIGMVPAVLGVLGGSIVFGVILAPFVINFVYPFFRGLVDVLHL